MRKITREVFDEVVLPKLTTGKDRATTIFENYGPLLAFDVANVLMHAGDQGKEHQVLRILEKHWEQHLSFQHPNIRGTVSNSLGINETQVMFLRICKDVLELQPNPS